MTEEGYLAALTYGSVFEPVLEILDKNGRQGALQLREALRAADSETPGFLLQLVRHVLDASGLAESVELYETVLRIQNRLPDTALTFRNEADPVYGQLAENSLRLRNALARIPVEIVDYRLFVRRTLEDIAGAMKGVLTAIDNFKKYLQTQSIDNSGDRLMSIIDRNRKDFVASCRDFVNLLKQFVDKKSDFTSGQMRNLYACALRLIFQVLSTFQSIKENIYS